MPSVSPKQKRFFGLVRAVQKGDVKQKDVSDNVKKAAKSMTDKQVKDFIKSESILNRIKQIINEEIELFVNQI